MHSNSHPEHEERQAAWSHYTEEQRKLVTDLAAWQITLGQGKAKGCSDSTFCKPAGADPSAWNRLKNGKYGGPFGGSIDALITTLRRHYLPQQRKLFTVAHTKIIFDGIDKAREAALLNDEKRAYWLTGETGLGKTTLAHAIAREKDGLRIHASPAWKTSYTVILRSVARKLGVLMTGEGKKRRELRTSEELEHAIEEHLNKAAVPTVLVFEEVRPFNQRTVRELLFFFLFLLNETRAVLVILSAPEFFGSFKRIGGEDAIQFLRRTLVMAGSSVDKSHAKAMLEGAFPGAPDLDASAASLARDAAARGEFDRLKEVTALLKDHFKDGRLPTLEDVERASDLYDQRHQFVAMPKAA